MGKLTICGQLKHQTRPTSGNNSSKIIIALLLIMLFVSSGCIEELKALLEGGDGNEGNGGNGGGGDDPALDDPIAKELTRNGFAVVYVDYEEGNTYVGYEQEDDFNEKELYAKFAYIFGIILVHSEDSVMVGVEAIFDDGESLIGYTTAEIASKFVADEISAEEFIMNLDIEYFENNVPEEVLSGG